MTSAWQSLLEMPPYPEEGYAQLADRLGRLMGAGGDVLLVQGEAIVALEAAATSLASPAVTALNVVTSPYGRWFGHWLRRGGATVIDLVAEPAKPISVEAFAAALDAAPAVNLVALVHAESASGILNPLPAIAGLARDRGALLVVDAVASVGGHPLDVDALGIDVVAIGPQKSLGGSAGVSALGVSRRAWEFIDRPDAPVLSTLSLMDLKRHWLDAGRGVLPGMPSALEFHALEAALDAVESEGLEAVIARHVLAAGATRDAVRALGLAPWVADEHASNLVTALVPPDGADIAAILAHPASIEAGIAAGVGPGAERLLRLNHTGRRARRDSVVSNIAALAQALGGMHPKLDIQAADRAITARYGEPR